MSKLGKTLLLRVAIVCAASAALAAQAQSDSKSFLWQIKSKSNTVYLYGTIHVGKNSFYPLSDAVEGAFKKSAKLVVEADVTNLDTMAATLPLMKYTPPASLDTQIPKPILERLKVQFARYKIPYEEVKQLKPFMAGGLLVIAEMTRLGYDQRYGVDGYFIEKAVLGGKEVLELESVEQQMKLLSSLPPEEQEAFLSNAITALESGKTADQITGMVNAWSIGDTLLLQEVVKKANEGMRMTEALDEKVLYGRNPAMLSKIEGYLAGEKIHFVAAGAMHLVGKRGLVEMLKAKGYEVKQL